MIIFLFIFVGMPVCTALGYIVGEDLRSALIGFVFLPAGFLVGLAVLAITNFIEEPYAPKDPGDARKHKRN